MANFNIKNLDIKDKNYTTGIKNKLAFDKIYFSYKIYKLMIIQDGVLKHVDASDLDSDGVLRIPNKVVSIDENVGCNIPGMRAIYFPDSVLRITGHVFNENPNLKFIHFGNGVASIKIGSFYNCPGLDTIQIPHKWTNGDIWLEQLFPNLRCLLRTVSETQTDKYIIQRVQNKYYYTAANRNICNITIMQLQPLIFTKSGSDYQTKIGIRVNRKSAAGNNLHHAINNFRKNKIMDDFERAIYVYDIKNNGAEHLDDCKTTLRFAMKKSLMATSDMNANERTKFYNYIRNIPKYLEYMDKTTQKYPNAQEYFYEFGDLKMSETLRIIMPRDKSLCVNQSCTRWLKRHPVSADEMHAIVASGYKNPGAFPYSWLVKTPMEKRGKLTQKLHALFRATTTQMYSSEFQTEWNTELADMEQKLSRLIKQPVHIEYLGSGNFAKAYTVQIPGDKKYIWKIYHSNRTGQTFNDWNHHTELQNSFLVSGKKYYGKIKFRKMSTAGISNQRGEIYLIYPYTEYNNKVRTDWVVSPALKSFHIYDRNIENFCGDTIIDIGALHINAYRINQPRYVLKISNTILYHSWVDLNYVLNHYTPKQIKQACDFISDTIHSKSYGYKTIRDKIIYLRNNSR